MTFANNCRPNNNQAVETCTQGISSIGRIYIRAASQELQGCIPRTAMRLRCNGLQPENCRVIYIPNIFTLHQIDMTGAGIDPSLLRCSEPCINHTFTQIRICAGTNICEKLLMLPLPRPWFVIGSYGQSSEATGDID